MPKLVKLWCLWLILVFSLPAHVLAMPPHPRLEDLIREGKVKMPPSYTDQARVADPAALKAAVSRAALTGSIKALAVLVDFSNKVHTVTPTFFEP